MNQEYDEEISQWFWRNKDIILSALKQHDANWVYDTERVIKEINEILQKRTKKK